MVDRPDVDEPFFREWEASRLVQKRSLPRTEALMHEFGIKRKLPFVTIGVVGSKGKGSTVAALSKCLTISGLKVGAITSPAYRDNRERIRLSNRIISNENYSEISAKLSNTLPALSNAPEGYVSPSGAFLTMGITYFIQEKIDVAIIEEGMGGQSDEISLIDFDALILTSVFLEHVGILGDSDAEIAEDLMGVVSEKTRLLFASLQDSEVERVISASTSEFGIERIFPEESSTQSTTLPFVLRKNFQLAETSARRIIETFYVDRRFSIPESLNLPGRYQLVNSELTGHRDWFLDSSNNPVSLGFTLDYLKESELVPTLVFVSFSNARNRELSLKMLEGYQAVEVKIDNPQSIKNFGEVTTVTVNEALVLARLNEGRSLFVGSIWFISNFLEALEIDLSSW